MKVTSSSGIFKHIYPNGSDLLLFEKRKLQSFEISYELFLLLWNRCLALLIKHQPTKSASESFEIT